MKRTIILLMLFCVTIFCTAQTTPQSAHLEIVKELISEGFYDEAYFQVNQLIIEFPNTFESFEARILLAELNFERGHYTDARMQLMTLLRNPFQLTINQRIKTYHTLGMIFFNEGNYEQAIESFEKLFLDFRNSPEAISALPYYFDSFFLLDDYQSVIVKTREMLSQYSDAELQAELIFQQAKAYFTGNMLPQANRNIQDIKNRFSHTMAAWKSTELEVLILARERGRAAAVTKLEQMLDEPLSRYMEERLSWLLVQYYLESAVSVVPIGNVRSENYDKAKNLLNFILNKFNLSENLSAYHLAWLKLMVADRDIRPILEREDFILRTSKDKAEYDEIIYYLARSYVLAQDYWKARGLLDENMISPPFKDEENELLHFEYQLLYAEIYVLQGQYLNGIELYNTLLNSFGHLGRNYEILMKLGDVYLFLYHQEGQALNFYRQAIVLARNTDENAKALQMTAQCLEALGQYSEALFTLNQIPIDNITDDRQRESISDRITLLQIFFHADARAALTSYIKRNVTASGNLSLIDYVAVLAIELKQFEEALELLHSGVTYEIRMERVKLYFLFAFKNLLEGNTQEMNRFLQLVENETQQLRTNISIDDRFMINCFQDFLENRGKIRAENVNNAASFVNLTPANRNNIDFRNFFRFQLWKYYQETEQTEEMLDIARTITADAFVGSLDFQLVQVMLASYHYQNQEYSEAINAFSKAERFLTLAHPEYYYQYAMSLYQSRTERDKAVDILQKLVLNNIENENLNTAKNLILVQWIATNRMQDALDILTQIPPLLRIDEDYRYFALIYNRQGRQQQEKEALLYIKDKTMNEYQRIATLHLLTGDRVMAEYTWNEILQNATQLENRLNAYASLGNMNFREENFRETITNHEEFFRLYNTSVVADDLLFSPDIVAKELIISYYMIDNRPRAETTQKNLNNHINRNPEILAEIRLYEGIYYTKMDPRRATRPLTQVIEDINTPIEIAFKAMYYRAIMQIQENKYEIAERDLETALNTEDETLKNLVRLTLGNLHFSREKYEDALELYYDIIVNDMDGSLAKDAAHNFALAARHISDWDIAIAAYKIIMDRWGQTHLDPQTRLTIGFSFYQAKEYDQALILLNQLLPDLPTNELKAEAQYWIAESFVGKNEFDNAIAEFHRLRNSYPRETRWTGLAELKIAEIYHARGDIDTAEALFREIIRAHGAASDLGREANKYLN